MNKNQSYKETLKWKRGKSGTILFAPPLSFLPKQEAKRGVARLMGQKRLEKGGQKARAQRRSVGKTDLTARRSRRKIRLGEGARRE